MKIKDDIIRHHKREMFLHYGEKCWWRNFLYIIRIILVCPVSTAQVERASNLVSALWGILHSRISKGYNYFILK